MKTTLLLFWENRGWICHYKKSYMQVKQMHPRWHHDDVKELSFQILEVLYVFIRFCLTTNAQHNVRTTEGRFAASRIPGRRARSLKYCTCQAHRDALFFTTSNVGKGAVCRDRAYFGLDGESAGGKGREGTHGYLEEYLCHIIPHVGITLYYVCDGYQDARA